MKNWYWRAYLENTLLRMLVGLSGAWLAWCEACFFSPLSDSGISFSAVRMNEWSNDDKKERQKAGIMKKESTLDLFMIYEADKISGCTHNLMGARVKTLSELMVRLDLWMKEE